MSSAAAVGTQLKRLLRNSSSFRSILRQMSSLSDKPVENEMLRKLTEAFKPVHLEIVNESSMHNVPKGSESHFSVFIVSEMFNDQTLIKRHQLVHEVLKEELKCRIHALSIKAQSKEQYEKSLSSGENQVGANKSPPCRGGFGL